MKELAKKGKITTLVNKPISQSWKEGKKNDPMKGEQALAEIRLQKKDFVELADATERHGRHVLDNSSKNTTLHHKNNWKSPWFTTFVCSYRKQDVSYVSGHH